MLRSKGGIDVELGSLTTVRHGGWRSRDDVKIGWRRIESSELEGS
jgi:hypothetical protein